VTTGALRRLVRQTGETPGETPERCDLCAAPTEAAHRHLLDVAGDSQLLCACHPCSLLFVNDAAGQGQYRLVPRRRVRLTAAPSKELGVPVGLAFFVPRRDGTVLAHYPSPGGATRWETDGRAWRDAADLRDIRADVEALLVNTARGAAHYWIVPIDECFRLVALVRKEWKGLSGGSRVWPRIETFFEELTEQSE
jgi:hypothetical protein